MSFVITAPELIEAAAHDLAGVGSTLGEATAFAAAPTTSIAAAGTDEISTAIAALFGSHGQQFQALSAQAAAFHSEFVGLMKSGAGAYLGTEVANAEQTLAGVVHAPAQLVGGGGAAGALAQAESAVATVGQTLGGFTQKVGGTVTALEHGGGASLLSGRMATGAQAISRSITALQTEVGALTTAEIPQLINGFNTFGATVAAPYQTLFTTTAANLQSIENTFAANPFPFLHQVINNQIGYAQTLGTELQSAIQNFPAEFANLPGNIQTGLHALSSVNPEALAQHFVNNQIGYAHTISTSLTSAAHDLGTGVRAASPSFQTAFHDLSAGNFSGAGPAFGQGLENLILPGFEGIAFTWGIPNLPLLPVVPLGPLGDLLPIFSIPGHMAQNFTNLFHAGSIPAQIGQNTTNLVNVLTNFGASFNPNDLGVSFGLPLQLLLDGIGAPVNGLVALHSSASAFINAVQTGNVAGAATAVLDAPAVFANGFLNGQTMLSLPTLPVTFSLGLPGFPPQLLNTVAQIPLGGLLTPLSHVSTVIDGQNGGFAQGTEFGGLIPGIHSFGTELADAIDHI